MVTYKTYDDYFTDLNITKETITEEDLTGTGTEVNPYVVKSLRGLLYVVTNTKYGISLNSKYLELDCDLVLNDETFDENGIPSGGDGVVYQWEPITNCYNLSFEGNGHTVEGLFFNDAERNNVAFFGASRVKEISNLIISNIYLNGSIGIAGICYNVEEISNCKVASGTIRGTDGGSGITRVASSIENCINCANIYFFENCAGIIWAIDSRAVIIKNCKNYGNLTVQRNNVSGLVGDAFRNTMIENCANYGDLRCDPTGIRVAGILCRFYLSSAMSSTTMLKIKNTYNYGSMYIEGSYTEIGGIVSETSGHTQIINCGNYGLLEGIGIKQDPHAGEIIGLMGYNSNYHYTNVRVTDCVIHSSSGLPIVGSIFMTKDEGTIDDLYIENCQYSYSGEKTFDKTIITRFIMYGARLTVKNITAHIETKEFAGWLFGICGKNGHIFAKNIIINLKCEIRKWSNMILESQYNGIAEINIEGVIFDNFVKFYYGSDFSGFYIDWKTGKIGLKAMSGKGFFQDEVSEELLAQKGFVKKDI